MGVRPLDIGPHEVGRANEGIDHDCERICALRQARSRICRPTNTVDDINPALPIIKNIPHFP